MSHLRSVFTAAAVALLVPTIALAAGVFPDVGDSHPFKGEIESLFRLGVVKGNPSGLYMPDKDVNRAEFLKLLYTAMSKQPKAIYAGCFKDVESGSWYEAYVCDAAAKENGFVQGYGDGTFKPANPVSRTEALKMTFMVMGLPAQQISAADKDVIKFADISVSAWYSIDRGQVGASMHASMHDPYASLMHTLSPHSHIQCVQVDINKCCSAKDATISHYVGVKSEFHPPRCMTCAYQTN
jgi:hypothetical protein